MKRTRYWPLAALAVIALAGCGSSDSSTAEGTTGATAGTTGSTPTPSGEKALVAFSQANSADPWRQVFDAETKAAAEKLSDMTLETQSAEDDPNKQISQIDTLMLKQPKVLLVSPSTEAVQGAIEKAYDAGTAVILLDRSIPGDKFTAFVGGDNVAIGREAATYIAEQMKGKPATVLMIQGLGGATATTDRKGGAMKVFGENPNLKVIQGDDCKYQRQAAQSYMETYLQAKPAPDVVYAHNDEMAIGAYNAWESWSKKQPGGTAKKPLFVGIDGCQQETINMIKDGKLDATFSYPIPGPKGIELAEEIIKGNKPSEKKILLPTQKVTKDTAEAYLTANPNLAK